jgi:hypothetical protein
MNPELILGPLLVLAVFLGIRRFWWWWLGIDRAIAALEDIALSLRTFPTVRQHDAAAKRRPPRAA